MTNDDMTNKTLNETSRMDILQTLNQTSTLDELPLRVASWLFNSGLTNRDVTRVTKCLGATVTRAFELRDMKLGSAEGGDHADRMATMADKEKELAEREAKLIAQQRALDSLLERERQWGRDEAMNQHTNGACQAQVDGYLKRAIDAEKRVKEIDALLAASQRQMASDRKSIADRLGGLPADGVDGQVRLLTILEAIESVRVNGPVVVRQDFALSLLALCDSLPKEPGTAFRCLIEVTLASARLLDAMKAVGWSTEEVSGV